MDFRFLLWIVPLLSVVCAAPMLDEFKKGDIIHLQCKNESGVWMNAPICAENQQPLSFSYGNDAFAFCGLNVPDPKTFKLFSDRIEQKALWACRVPMSPSARFFIPININLWGISEADHFHLGNHQNFVFHTDHGHIMGASVYPVRDRFQYGRAGSLVHIHGPIKWFQAHSYTPVSGISHHGHNRESWSSGLFFFGIFLGFIFSSAAFALLFHFVLRPRILRKLIEGKQD